MLSTVSIITITYNAERFLERTILSVMAQKAPNVEYIVIDGASTDGTLDIIKRYEKQITSWISEPDQGLYDAMNKGLHRATGQYVWFMNAGDELYDSQTLPASNAFCALSNATCRRLIFQPSITLNN